MPMSSNRSVDYFDVQFRHQADAGDLQLNPFEEAALPHLRGRLLDFGCGMGNLAVAAAKRGCSVVALDASNAAISHLQNRAKRESLDINAMQADLRSFEVSEDFDTIVSIGLLMFFDRPTAYRSLATLQARVRVGGTAVVNVMIEGSTYMAMFEPEAHCLFPPRALEERFADWKILYSALSEFPAPDNSVKSFATVIAQKKVAQ